MRPLFRFPTAVPRDPRVDAWMRGHSGELGAIADRWFQFIRSCGPDVRELLHDGHPTACVGDAAFVYVNAFRAHVNVGFFQGADIPDPKALLEGDGKFMRHVKLKPAGQIDVAGLEELILAAYVDVQTRLQSGDR